MREKKPENFFVVGVAIPVVLLIVSAAARDAVSAGTGFVMAGLVWLSLAFKYRGGKRLFSLCCFLLLTAALVWLRPSGLGGPSNRPRQSVSSAPVASPRPLVQQARPRPDDGELVPALNDRNVLHYAPRVIVFLFLFGGGGWLLSRAVREFRNNGEWTAFFPLLIVVVILGGGSAWVRYFAGHGAFLIWPIVVAVAVFGLAILRAVVLDRQRREYAEELQQVDKAPVHGGAAEATPDDERRFGL